MATSTSDVARPPQLMDRLRRVGKRTLAAAGPRYSPAIDPSSPNLEIEPLQRAASALSLGAALRSRARALEESLRTAYDRDHYLAERLFGRRTVNLERLADDLSVLASGGSIDEVRKGTLVLRRHLNAVRGRLEGAKSDAYTDLRALDEANQKGESEEDKRKHSQERERIQGRLSAFRRLDEPLSDIGEFADGHAGQLLTRSSAILLLGDWGTGKTHFLCDFAPASAQ